MKRRAVIGALLLVGLGVVLGTTVFRTDIAQATGLAQSVTVNNTTSNPVPVREQNLDGSNIRVHEEGTATVHVDNLPATQAVSISPPANAFSFSRSWSGVVLGGTDLSDNDPAGTRYAISSVTLASTSTDDSTVTLFADPWSGGCPTGAGQALVTVAAPAHGTASASLPQPFISGPTSGSVCLDITYTGTASLAVVGYKISP
jgi:hypothetical protein